MSFFDTVELLPDDPILGMPALFNADKNPKKVNLGIGAYADSEGRPYILTTVREVEKGILSTETSKEYLPIEGGPDFIRGSLDLIFGPVHPRIKAGDAFAAQGIGGTGALRLGAEFLAQHNSKVAFISHPSWPNHKGIFERSGMRVEFYKYYDPVLHRIDFAGLCASIKIMPPASFVVLQAGCHNPTGVDLSFDQWKELSDLIKKQKVFPFFDLAYQGFGTDIDEDAKPIRYFAEQGHEMAVANSYSKNFGLYGERIGMLTMLTSSPEQAKKVGSQIKQIIRGIYSNPPLHGALIVGTILNNEKFKTAWKHELQSLRDRIIEMREALTCGLQAKSIDRDFTFISKQKGIFSFTGLTKEQVIRMREEWAIYMIQNSRINIAGLNQHNLDYVIDAILAVTKQ